MALLAVLRRHRYAGRLAMIIGSSQVVWIIMQVARIEKPPWLQPLLLLVGVGIAGLGARLNGTSKVGA